MFINKTQFQKNNTCAERVRFYRKKLYLSQRGLADQLQLAGLDVSKNVIQKIESGKRYVTDIELVYLCKVLDVTFDMLIDATAVRGRKERSQESSEKEISI